MSSEGSNPGNGTVRSTLPNLCRTTHVSTGSTDWYNAAAYVSTVRSTSPNPSRTVTPRRSAADGA
eukprot:3193817-Rhodomonas_salina.1